MEKIKIKKIGRKDMPSKYKEGETYALMTVLDHKNRKLTAFGKWAEGWKVDDVVEVNIVEKTWRDKDGFEQVNLNLENPNKGQFTPGGGRGGGFNFAASAYNNAVMYLIAVGLSGEKKKVTLEEVDKVAAYFLTKISSGSGTPVAETTKVKTVDVEEDIKPLKKKAKAADEEFEEAEETTEETEEEDPF